MRKISGPILCSGLAVALVRLGGWGRNAWSRHLLLTSFVPALIFTLIGLILRNFEG